MHLTAWKYQCGHCGEEYVLPGCDLSFAYGNFLGVSRNGEAAVLEAVGSETFDELRLLIDVDPRVRGLTSRERISLLHEALSLVFDPDSRGDDFAFVGSPGCPNCSSRAIASFTETSEPVPVRAGRVTHHRWDSMTDDEQRRLVTSFLDRSVDGA